jgi:hypothetical protein
VAKVLHVGYFWDNGIQDIVYFAKFGKLGLRIMKFGILEFHKNIHFRIMRFGLLSSGKGIFGKLGFRKSSDKGIKPL